MLRGTGRFVSPTSVVVDGPDGEETIECDAALVATGSPSADPRLVRSPTASASSRRATAYPPQIFPESITVVGSGVTGVEFVHMFSSFGAKVTLVVSRQQVLPGKDPEVAAVLEDDFLRRGVKLLKGARAESIERRRRRREVRCDDGRSSRSTHAVLAIGSIPNTDGLGLEMAGVDLDGGGYVGINQHCQRTSRTSTPRATSAASCRCPPSPRCRDARSPSTSWACTPAAIAISTTTRPRRPSSPSPRSPTSASPRRRRSPRPQDPRHQGAVLVDRQGADQQRHAGFVKIISDPATGDVLGGSIVGRHAAELISVIALAVTARLKVTDLVESILVHPALSEALAEAAE